MITRMTHPGIFVLDQDSAKDFYVNKLGFTLTSDTPFGEGGRWLTVSPPQQPDLTITLMAVKDGLMFTKETAAQMRSLVEKGTFGFGVFECDDIYATYEELKAK